MYRDEMTALVKADARFLVVGAVALSLHGYPRLTADLDIVPDMDEENLGRIDDCLLSIGYLRRLPVSREQLLDPVERRDWFENRNLRAFTYYLPTADFRQVDLLLYHELDFEEAYSASRTVKLHGVPVQLASARDLLFMKERANRDKDQPDIVVLREVVRREQDD